MGRDLLEARVDSELHTVTSVVVCEDFVHAWSCGADHHLAKYALREAYPSKVRLKDHD